MRKAYLELSQILTVFLIAWRLTES